MKRWIIFGGIGLAVLGLGAGAWWHFRVKGAKRLEVPAGPSSEEAVQSRIKILAASKKSEDRRSAVKTSAEVKEAEHVARIIGPLVMDADVQVREAAVKRLATVHHPQSVEWLKKGLSDKDYLVVVHSADSLARLGDDSGREAALKILKDVEDEPVAVAVLSMVGALKDVKSKRLVKKYLERPEPSIQKAAQAALASLEAREKELQAQTEKMREDERKKKEEEQRKREEEGARAEKLKEAQTKFQTSMAFYRKKLKDPAYHGNDAVAQLNRILELYKNTGVDVSEVKKELVLQEKIRADKRRQETPSLGKEKKPASPPPSTGKGPSVMLTGKVVPTSSNAKIGTTSGSPVPPTKIQPGPVKLTGAVVAPSSPAAKSPLVKTSLASAAVKPTSSSPRVGGPKLTPTVVAPSSSKINTPTAKLSLASAAMSPTSGKKTTSPSAPTLKAGTVKPTSKGRKSKSTALTLKESIPPSKPSSDDMGDEPIIRMTGKASGETATPPTANTLAPDRAAPTSR